MKIIYKERIIPNKLILDSKFRKIKITNSEYYIDKFTVYLNENNHIEKLIIDTGKHPNCNPKNKEFCLPDLVKNINFIEYNNFKPMDLIISMLELYNFNSSYFQPWNEFEYDNEFEYNDGVL